MTKSIGLKFVRRQAADESAGDEPAADSSAALEGPGELTTPAPAERKPRKARRNRFLFPDGLETKRGEYRLTDEGLTALYVPGPWKVVKEITTKRREITPASAYVVEQVRFEYARVENEDGGPVVINFLPANRGLAYFLNRLPQAHVAS